MFNIFKKMSQCVHNTIQSFEKLYCERIKKTSLVDGLLFGILYSQKGKTQQVITGDLNSLNQNHKDKNVHISRQSFSNRFDNIGIEVYEEINNVLEKYIDSNFDKRKKKYDITKSLVAVDGTYITLRKSLMDVGFHKTNQSSVKALNMCLFNVTRNYPVTLQMVKHLNERKAFFDVIKKPEKYKNNIFVYDRGYQGEAFFKNLTDRELKFVCRINDYDKWYTGNKNDCIVELETVKIRVITYMIKDVKYILATNIFDKKIKIDTFKKIYHDRWSVEEYFKFGKGAFNFSNFEITDENSIAKCIMTQIIISKILFIITKMTKHVDGHTINKKTLASGLYRDFLYLFFNNKLTNNNIKMFLKNYVFYQTSNKGKQSERKCVRPNFKWSIKQYHRKYIKSELINDDITDNIADTAEKVNVPTNNDLNPT